MNTNYLKWFGLIGICSFAVIIGLPISDGNAQVALSLGAEEIYDSNVYLEDDFSVPAGGAALPKDSDGERNDDFITRLSLGLAGAVTNGEYVKGGLDGTVGFAFFANEGDESRADLNTTLKFEATERMLRKPYFLEAKSELESGNKSLGDAAGSIARQSVSHTASLGTGIRDQKLSDTTFLSFGYEFSRYDFIGELNFGSHSDLATEEEGSDYFSNAITSTLGHDFSPRLSGDITAGTDYLSFTNIESNSLVNPNSDDLDRFDTTASTGVSYRVKERVTLSGRVGLDWSHYMEDTGLVTVLKPDSNGELVPVTEERDTDDTSLFFSVGAGYQPLQQTTLNFGVSQGQGIDIDGQRTLSRGVTLNAVHQFSDLIAATAGGSYTQFADGDSLSDPGDRFDLAASLRFTVAEATTINLGYNFTVQDANEADISSDSATDYEGHRVFLSVNTGFVGLKG